MGSIQKSPGISGRKCPKSGSKCHHEACDGVDLGGNGGISKSCSMSGSKRPLWGRECPLEGRKQAFLPENVIQLGEDLLSWGEKWYFWEKVCSSWLQVSHLVVSWRLFGRKSAAVVREGAFLGADILFLEEKVKFPREKWYFWEQLR